MSLIIMLSNLVPCGEEGKASQTEIEQEASSLKIPVPLKEEGFCFRQRGEESTGKHERREKAVNEFKVKLMLEKLEEIYKKLELAEQLDEIDDLSELESRLC